MYENDEEKCLVENELAELAEIREILENGRLKELRESHKQTVDENMIREYRGLDELKEQDTLELNEDSERIQTLREGKDGWGKYEWGTIGEDNRKEFRE